MKKLTAKQQLFVQEYLVDLNATQAAIRAGYSKKSAEVIGHENLRKPNIQSAIEEATNKRSERVEIDQDYVLKRLKEEAEYKGKDSTQSARVSALSWIGKHLQMFTDNLNVKADIDLHEASDDDLDRAISEHAAKAGVSIVTPGEGDTSE